MTDYLNEAVQKIAACIRFDSSLGKRTENAPFGQGAYDCLRYFLSVAEEMGFETHNYDGYIGEVIFGKGPEEFAVLCHLDVVPAGDGWKKPPFGGVVEDGKIWGRGAVDDKGPAVCALYAMKQLKDEGFLPEKRIKLIVGCNEESGWKCIDHYKEVAALPETGFSPDAEFPVIYAEKGILHVRLHFPVRQSPILFLEGGTSANMVCDLCVAQPYSIGTARAKELGLKIDGYRLISHGKSAHGSTPEKGKNAIYPVLEYFARRNPDIRRAVDCVFTDIYGLKNLHDETGSLTMSPNLVKYLRKELRIVCDIRYPATMKASDVHKELAKFGVKYETLHHQPPLYHDKNSKLIQELLAVYSECTGKRARPIAIGGGTYARALKFGVGFGPEMKGDEPVIHRANEYITVERVKLLIELYRNALKRLTV